MAQKENMVRTVVFLTTEHIDRLAQLHKEVGVKPTETVRRALDLYFSKPIKRGRR